jgi:hypothetical protein
MGKSVALVPDMPILLIVIADEPMLLRVTGVGVPVEPSATLPHTTLRGSTRTPTTRQPVKGSDKRRTTERNKLPGCFRMTIPNWIALRVIVTSSGFIPLSV